MTERRLYLLRHAKSSWEEPGLPDHDRPLAPRGRRAAKAIGRHLRDHGIEPELVLCSSAVRAQQTLERIGLEGRIEPELYGAGAEELLERLHAVPASVRSVMLIGHNPDLQELALLLASDARELETKFPTGALATLTLRAWAALGPGTAELTGFVRPRDLDR
jgi:phosphohistidine phosphatase